jgi:multicomponent Na+:H+ antiporter subunit C
MELLLSIMVGALVAASVYLMLARNVLRFLFGLILISNAANLTIFVAGRLTPEAPPLIPVWRRMRPWGWSRMPCRRRWC